MDVDVTILLLLPLVGALISFVSKGKSFAFLGATVSIFLTGLYASFLLYQGQLGTLKFEWVPGVSLGWQLDRLSLLLVLLVLFISFLVHVFSIAYMEKDNSRHRYFALLGFFTFSMIGLLIADHLLLLFIFWELVGFSSYLLIGFWWQQEENAFAARYAFIANRIADVALFSGILWLLTGYDISFISDLNAQNAVPTVISLLLVIGAFGKSAQGPFFTWLPRAMAGPTPVSALIHAATMVAAGVYLLIRIFPLLSPMTLAVVISIGALTALLGAVSAMTTYDIKRVLAFSTISQLGYMVMGVGAGAPEAAFFHLWTHAFFKAGLFLSAGAVIHYMHYIGHHGHAQDMRAMGGIKKHLPVVFYGYTVCMLALVGLPFFTGFFSKEGIILQTILWSQAYQWGFIIPAIALFAAGLTAFYMLRQWLYVFFGQYRGEHLAYHFRESIPLKVPVALLSIASLFFWYSWNPAAHQFDFLNFVFADTQAQETVGWLAPVSIVIALLGLGVSYFRYKGLLDSKQSVEVIREEFDRSRKGLLSLSFHAFYVDWFYVRVLSRGFIFMSRQLYVFDKKWIDGLVNGVGVMTVLLSKVADLMDKIIVDGVVNLVTSLQVGIGNMIRLFHASRVQLQFFWAVFFLVLVIIGFELF